MTDSRYARRLLLGALLAAPALALAHTGHDPAPAVGFVGGLAHPFSGLDHLLAMIAVGLWSAASLRPGRRWSVPAVFVGAMTIGALGAVLGLPRFGALEGLVAASVLVLGLMVVCGRTLGLGSGLLLTAVAGALHGTAHGLEMVPGTSFAAYAAGFVVATCALHVAGLGAGAWLAAWRSTLLRHAGACIGLAGALLLVARI